MQPGAGERNPEPALAMLKDFKARIGAVAGSLRGRAERKAVAREFDREFYLRSNPDVAAARVDPLDHFLKLGWHERRNPTPGFDVQHYTVSNPDVAASGLNPFYHFVAHGRAEGRSPLPSLPKGLGLQGLGQVDPSAAVRVQTDVTNVPVGPPSAGEREAMAGAFDREFYLASNPDVAAAGVDPFEHYLAVGAREGRSPTPGFVPTYYQEANPDVAAAGLNPFYHYLVAGRAEGRRGRRPHAAERQLIAEARPMTKRAAEWSAAQVWRRPVEYDALARALRILLPAHRDTVVVALSHDDYTRVPGGIQNCIGDEQAAFNRSGLSYVHLAPAIPLPTLSYADVNDFLLIVTVDGEQVGCATAPDFLSVLADRRHEDRFKLILTIHSLLGSSAALIQAIQERLAPDRSFVWVHDFSTLCSNYALLRNDVEFCWSPPIASNACGICAYGAERQAHWKAIEAIFEALKPIVLAPSEPAREFWAQRAKFPHAEIRVAPHAHPEITGARAPLANTPRPVRVAFVGNSGAHKGWHVFVELAKLRWGDPRYSFFHLSSYPSAPVAGVAHIPVTVSAADRYAMTNALITHEIDVVVNWTLCYETFSFTTYESILAGAMVLVRADAGNATYLVTTEPSGAAVADKEELFRMFEDGTVLDLLREYRSKPIPIGRLVPDSSAVRIALD